MGLFASVLCLLSAVLPARADVVINEIVSSNDQSHQDEKGDSPDWVELWNSGATNVDLSGWILTDKANKPKKADEWWRFPNGSKIGPGEHLVVFADGTGPDGPQPSEAKLEPDDDSLKANLVAWYCADDLADLSNGSSVSTWADKSGRGNDATGSASLVKDAGNGHAALQFASSSKQKFSLPLHNANFGLTSMADVTVIIVARPTSLATTSSGTKGLFDVSHPSSNKSYTSDKYQYNTYFEIYGTGGALRSRSGYYGTVVSASSAVAKNTWYALAFTTESAGRETALTSVYRNGELKASGQPAKLDQTGFTSSSVMYLGNSQYVMKSTGTRASEGSYFDGYMAEVVIYNRALTAEEYEAVYNALNAKYGLAGKTEVKHHTNFSISGSGETVTLMTPDKAVVDALTFGRIPCDCSYGRVTDGAADCAWFGKEDVSPEAANGGTTWEEPLGSVEFSVGRRVFDTTETVTLELSYPADPEAKIYYTTDRSDPSPTNGTEYTGQAISFSKTTVVKATVVKDGHLPYRNVTAHSYIFLDQVADQTKANADYPDKWEDDLKETFSTTHMSTPASYGLSAGVIRTDDDRAALVAALKAAPIVSVTLSDSDLFNAEDGLYLHPTSMEDREPVQADVEWVTGDDVFGTSCGLDMHGAYSRRFNITAKKSFKLKFSGVFGAGSLDHAVLKDGGCEVEEFKKLVLRAESNHHWTSMETDNQGGWPELGTYMHDQFLRNTQKLTSGFQAEGTHVHLFLNGMYWGLYNLTDHICDGFAATTWSGGLDERKNYDVISNSGLRDGSQAGWDAAKALAKKGFSNQAAYDAVTNAFDVVGYIDYLLIEWFSANEDWAENNNNWAVAGSAKLGVPYRYVLWDVDKTLRVTASESSQMGYNLLGKTSGPMEIHAALKSNAEYKMLFADRIQKHLFGDGALTVASIVARYGEMADKVRPRLFAEAARWGSYQYDNYEAIADHRQTTKARYGLADWDKERVRLTGEDGWFSQRHATLVDQLKSASLWSDAIAKVSTITMNEDGTATLTVPSGTTAYYTLDGSDPREMFTGNAVGTECTRDTTVELPKEGGTLKVRVASGTTTKTWSALTEITFEGVKRNELTATKKDAVWDDDANWSLGYYPNAAGAIAILGVPGKVSGKFNRKVAISNETGVTVGHVEITNDTEKYNVIANFENADGTMSGGDLTFCGEISGDGATTNDATLAVLDTTGAGYAKISLEAPTAVVRLASDLDVTVSNATGRAEYGGLLVEGAIEGNGHNLAKWGPGRMTLAATNAVRTVAASAIDAGAVAEAATVRSVLGNIQCNEGIVAVEAPLHITSVTKDGGTIWLKLGGTDVAAAFEPALVCDKNFKEAKAGLFVPTTIGSDTESFYGGVYSAKAPAPGEVTVYVQDPNGEVTFCGEKWSAHEGATVGTTTLNVGDVNYTTYKIDVPYFGPTYALRYEPGEGVSGEPVAFDLAPFAEHTVIDCPFTNGEQPFTGWRGPDGKTWQPGEVVSNLTETGSSVTFTATWFGITVGGKVFVSVQEAVAAANSTTPLAFAVEPSVEGRTITANGESATVKDFYDIAVSADGKTLTLKLNDTVKAESNTFTEVEWTKGEMRQVQRKGFMTRKGFWYALGKDGKAETKWLKGDGTPQAIEPPEEGEWDVLVSDVEK